MIKRIILFLFIPSLVIAVFLSLAGVHSIPFGDNRMYSWFQTVQYYFDNVNFYIPDIPNIPKVNRFENPNGWLVVLNILIFLLDVIITFVNAIVYVINFISSVVNVVLSLCYYLFIFIYCLKDLKGILT